MTIARSTRIASRRFRLGGALLTLALATASALAQDVLPRPAEPFAGKIGTTYADSTAAFPAPVTAPAGAPNVMLVLTDDVGFGAVSTFGGAIPTPHLDRLAGEGLRFNRFHTTAMCSPTRASLLTGRNHHAVGNGIVANLSTGFPGYNNLQLCRIDLRINGFHRRPGYFDNGVGEGSCAVIRDLNSALCQGVDGQTEQG